MSISACLCCINNKLNTKKSNKISTNRSCVEKTALEKGKEYCLSLAQQNLEDLYDMILWNEYHGIYNLRLSSDIFPHRTNPKMKFYDISSLYPIMYDIGFLTNKLGHRLSMHPDQFVQIGTPTREVFEKSKVELNHHCEILERTVCDKNGLMIIHGGGVYENKSIGLEKSKQITIERWVKQFYELDSNVRDRLILENCEKCYSIEDCLIISRMTNIPVVYDSHHYRCYNILHPDRKQRMPSQLLPIVIQTWRNRYLEPIFHISNQREGARCGAHSDYIEKLDYEFERLVENKISFQLDIEAKAKEDAIMDLYKKYKDKNVFYTRQSTLSKNDVISMSKTKKIEDYDFLF